MFRRHPLPLGLQRGDDAVLDCLQYFAALGAQASRAARMVGMGLAGQTSFALPAALSACPLPCMIPSPNRPKTCPELVHPAFLQVTLVTLDRAFAQRAVELGLSCLQPQQLLAAVHGALGGMPVAAVSADGGGRPAGGSSSGGSGGHTSDYASSSSDNDSDGSSDSGSSGESDADTSSSSRGRGSATESCTEDEAVLGGTGGWVRRRLGPADAHAPPSAVPMDWQQTDVASHAPLAQQPAAAEAQAASAPQGGSQATAARMAQQLLLAAANLLGSALGASPAMGSAEGPACGLAADAAGLHSAERMLQATQGVAAAAHCLPAVPDPQLPPCTQSDGLGPISVVQLQDAQGMAHAPEQPPLPRAQCSGLVPSIAAPQGGLQAAPLLRLQPPLGAG